MYSRKELQSKAITLLLELESIARAPKANCAAGRALEWLDRKKGYPSLDLHLQPQAVEYLIRIQDPLRSQSNVIVVMCLALSLPRWNQFSRYCWAHFYIFIITRIWQSSKYYF